MPEDFSELSNQSIWTLVQNIVAIGDVLKKELPFDSLTPSWHVEDGTDEFTVGILARWADSYHCIVIQTRYLDEPPEPKEMYPAACCAVGTLQVFSPEPLPREVLEICGTLERWMVHDNDKWVPLTASYVAFLMGMNRKLPDAK
jgi:hypothetical protein